MVDFGERIKDMIDELRRRRQEIDSAIRQLEAVAESLVSSTQPEAHRPTTKKRAAEWAAELLQELGNHPTHYHEIARQLIIRGYRGHPQDGETIGSQEHIDRIARSLSGTLTRQRELFEATGKGYFKLRSLQDP
jgi:hypothetical protein